MSSEILTILITFSNIMREFLVSLKVIAKLIQFEKEIS